MEVQIQIKKVKVQKGSKQESRDLYGDLKKEYNMVGIKMIVW